MAWAKTKSPDGLNETTHPPVKIMNEADLYIAADQIATARYALKRASRVAQRDLHFSLLELRRLRLLLARIELNLRRRNYSLAKSVHHALSDSSRVRAKENALPLHVGLARNSRSYRDSLESSKLGYALGYLGTTAKLGTTNPFDAYAQCLECAVRSLENGAERARTIKLAWLDFRNVRVALEAIAFRVRSRLLVKAARSCPRITAYNSRTRSKGITQKQINANRLAGIASGIARKKTPCRRKRRDRPDAGAYW